jgi:hypothetical protein
MSAVAIIVPALSVVVSGCVAVFVPRQAAKADDGRLARQINAARKDELRGVLEDAGLALSDACDAALDLRLAVEHPIANDPKLAAAQQRMESALEAAGNQVNRILIRLGPDNHLTTAYRGAFASLAAALSTVWLFEHGDPSPSEQVAAFVSQARERTDEFYGATAEAVGPRVPLPSHPT